MESLASMPKSSIDELRAALAEYDASYGSKVQPNVDRLISIISSSDAALLQFCATNPVVMEKCRKQFPAELDGKSDKEAHAFLSEKVMSVSKVERSGSQIKTTKRQPFTLAKSDKKSPVDPCLFISGDRLTGEGYDYGPVSMVWRTPSDFLDYWPKAKNRAEWRGIYAIRSSEKGVVQDYCYSRFGSRTLIDGCVQSLVAGRDRLYVKSYSSIVLLHRMLCLVQAKYGECINDVLGNIIALVNRGVVNGIYSDIIEKRSYMTDTQRATRKLLSIPGQAHNKDGRKDTLYIAKDTVDAIVFDEKRKSDFFDKYNNAEVHTKFIISVVCEATGKSEADVKHELDGCIKFLMKQ